VKFLLGGEEQRSKTSVAVSIAVHIVAIAALATLTIKIPLILYHAPDAIATTAVHYVVVKPQPSRPLQGGGGTPTKTRGASETTVLAPTSIPTAPPVPVAPSAAPSTSLRVGNADRRADPGRAATGVTLASPDARSALDPESVGRLPLSKSQRADSALTAIYGIYLDSVRAAMANPGRAPGDWSWGGKNGDKWGWDQNGIHIGGITIPNAVLAALPLNMGPGGENMNSITNQRTDAYIRNDIAYHSTMMTQDEFKDAVRRIRDRVDREKQEALAKRRKPDPPPPDKPPTPPQD
jgi:hypothetical protein